MRTTSPRRVAGALAASALLPALASVATTRPTPRPPTSSADRVASAPTEPTETRTGRGRRRGDRRRHLLRLQRARWPDPDDRDCREHGDAADGADLGRLEVAWCNFMTIALASMAGVRSCRPPRCRLVAGRLAAEASLRRFTAGGRKARRGHRRRRRRGELHARRADAGTAEASRSRCRVLTPTLAGEADYGVRLDSACGRRNVAARPGAGDATRSQNLGEPINMPERHRAGRRPAASATTRPSSELRPRQLAARAGLPLLALCWSGSGPLGTGMCCRVLASRALSRLRMSVMSPGLT